MKFFLQRVSEARVTVNGERVGSIGAGFLVLMGIAPTDTKEIADTLIRKLLNLRVFEDEAGLMNRSLLDTGGSVLAVSQFTLYADTRKGNRPGFSTAAHPSVAEPLYAYICDRLRALLGPGRVGTGRFGAEMRVALVNEGPVSIELRMEADPE